MIRTLRGKAFGEATHSISLRIGVTLSKEALEDADKQEPTAKKIWDLAMSNEHVARALFYFSEAKGEDMKNLYKVYEEVMIDIKSSNISKQTVVEGKQISMFEMWANDPSITGKSARHSWAKAFEWLIGKKEKSRKRQGQQLSPWRPMPNRFSKAHPAMDKCKA